MKRSRCVVVLQALLVCAWVQSASAQINLTIYQSGPGQVQEQREVNLRPGATTLLWRPVAARILPESLWLGAPRGVQLHDFELRSVPLTPATLLRAYVGKTIEVRTRDAAGREQRRTALVLSADGPVLQINGRVESGPFRHLVFPAVPSPLGQAPALVMDLRGGHGGRALLDLNYLCGGLTWRADYVARLSANGKDMDLTGWAALSNQSGMDYVDARVALVAGQPHRASPGAPFLLKGVMVAESVAVSAEAWQDYQRYVLPRSVTLPDGATRWVDFFAQATMPLQREYVVNDTADYANAAATDRQALPVAVRLRLPGIGQPLPAGVVRVYGASHGHEAYLGEDRIAALPRETPFSIQLGRAFDVTASRVQTDFKRLGGAPTPTYESAWRIVLRNAQPRPVKVKVTAQMPGDWEILQESAAHERPAAGTAQWQVAVKAESEAVLSYRVRTRY